MEEVSENTQTHTTISIAGKWVCIKTGFFCPLRRIGRQLSVQPTKSLPLLRRFPLPNLNPRSKLSTTLGATNFRTISSARREVMTCCDQQVRGMRVVPYRTLGRPKKSKCWPRQRRPVVKRGRRSLRPVMSLRRAACADVQVCDAKTPQAVSLIVC
jgi:hypothetical protein